MDTGVLHTISHILLKRARSIQVAGNRFTYDGMKLEISEHVSIIGKLQYNKITPFRYSWNERGVMGWYGFIPFMETYHGILSLDHFVNGKIEIEGVEYVFLNGKGYIEKDWGKSFPSSWIWMQSNSFSDSEISFMLSIAVIPWLRTSFIGHLAISE